ncbi:hypothetical protein Gohar_027141, partial [Gossypium harknessii]|nr:hypothetical protein [Gossypium harknessii]
VPRIRNDFEKEKLLRRIEPWIQRELEAILGDPDPSIILHVVSSLLFSRHEGKHDGSSTSSTQLSFVNDNFLAPLEPFLHDRTNMFWHELRCFVDSPFTMETYDAVVEYRQSVPSELVILDGLVMAALSVVKPSVLSNCLKLRDPRSRGFGSRRISRAEQIKHVSRSCKQA